MGKEKLFTKEENRAYRRDLIFLTLQSFNSTMEWMKIFEGRKTETAQYKLAELKQHRREEVIQRSIIEK